MMARTPTESAAMIAAHPSGRIVAPSEGTLAAQLAGTSLGAVPVAVAQPVAQPEAMAQPLPAGQEPVVMGQPVGQ